MSDERLRELERRYQETDDLRDELALLHQLAKREPLPCPNCARSFSCELSPERECTWCGTRWTPRPTRAHIKRVEFEIARRAKPALKTEGAETGRLSGITPQISNAPATVGFFGDHGHPLVPAFAPGALMPHVDGDEIHYDPGVPRLVAGHGIDLIQQDDGQIRVELALPSRESELLTPASGATAATHRVVGTVRGPDDDDWPAEFGGKPSYPDDLR
jgi:hypothetical protein